MLSFRKNKSETSTKSNQSFFGKLTQGLKRTRTNFSEGLTSLFLGKKVIDEKLLEEIEARLLTADVGIAATQKIIQDLTMRMKRKELTDAEALMLALKNHLRDILLPVNQPFAITDSAKPFVILMVGINGAGKTTTIGKLAKQLQKEGKSVLLAAGDTFRAAAVEQLQIWGERNQIPVISQQSGSDSASVIYDALAAATARKIDVLIADTAGLFHHVNNPQQLMVKQHSQTRFVK